jgi:tetratricopeptide (TPR) repeat protein
MIARINTADPPLKKADLMLRGVGGEVSAADQQAITATQTTGRKESLLWSDLGTQAPGKLLELAVDRTRADDWLSAGVFALDIGNVDLAERLLARAGQMGLDIGPYRDPLAQAAFDAARMLLDAGDFSQAADALAALETKYSSIPWWSMNQSAVAAARAAAAEGLHEHEANELYTKAAEYFAQNELFEVKPLLEKLGAEYGDIVTLLDPAGRPPLAELKQSVANLGHRFSVCLDGKGDFRSIQAAIDAAPANSLIEIQDSGPYIEQVAIQTVGLTLRGAADAWPVITSLGANRDFERLVHVLGDGTTLERLIIVHGTPQGERAVALDVGAAGCRIRAVMSMVPRAEQSEAKAFGCWNKAGAWTDLADCLFIGESFFAAPARAANCLFVSEFTNFHGTCRIENCTVSKKAQFVLSESVVRNSIIGSVHIFDQALQSFRMECCNIFGPDRFWGHNEPKTGFFFGDPRFRDPPNLDYRLMSNSPCIGKADDGGDLGVRYTPEMTEMVRRALEMRARGIIQF